MVDNGTLNRIAFALEDISRGISKLAPKKEPVRAVAEPEPVDDLGLCCSAKGTEKAETPVGVPWGLIWQIVQVIIAILTYLMKSNTASPAERSHFNDMKVRMECISAFARNTIEKRESEE